MHDLLHPSQTSRLISNVSKLLSTFHEKGVEVFFKARVMDLYVDLSVASRRRGSLETRWRRTAVVTPFILLPATDISMISLSRRSPSRSIHRSFCGAAVTSKKSSARGARSSISDHRGIPMGPGTPPDWDLPVFQVFLLPISPDAETRQTSLAASTVDSFSRFPVRPFLNSRACARARRSRLIFVLRKRGTWVSRSCKDLSFAAADTSDIVEPVFADRMRFYSRFQVRYIPEPSPRPRIR